jgi:hypothetical protein
MDMVRVSIVSRTYDRYRLWSIVHAQTRCADKATINVSLYKGRPMFDKQEGILDKQCIAVQSRVVVGYLVKDEAN